MGSNPILSAKLFQNPNPAGFGFRILRPVIVALDRIAMRFLSLYSRKNTTFQKLKTHTAKNGISYGHYHKNRKASSNSGTIFVQSNVVRTFIFNWV